MPSISGSLVIYRRTPAKLIKQIGNKFELSVNQTLIKVRQKDFIYLHPDYASININLNPKDLVISDELLAVLIDQTLSIEELCLWVFNDYTPQTAYQTYALTQDKIYCYWQKDSIVIRPMQQVAQLLAKKQAETLERQQRLACIERLKNNQYDQADDDYIQEIVAVALCQRKQSKTLVQLGVDNTPEQAQNLLTKIGYYPLDFNPYPIRYKNPNCLGNISDTTILPKDNAINRTDLSHLTAYAIDDQGSLDADDALSIEGDRFWVHIADVAAFISPDSDLDTYAKMRGNNLYLPEQTLLMLPKALINLLALGINQSSLALSINFQIVDHQIIDVKICHSQICITNISYEQVQNKLGKHKILDRLEQVAIAHQVWRQEQGAIQLTLPKKTIKYQNNQVSFLDQKHNRSRLLVAEWMIIAGRAIAEFALQNNIAMPFLSQADSQISSNIKQQSSLTLAEQFELLGQFKHSQTSINAKPHHGLGLTAYIRSTSPLRRYLDLVTHQQLHAYLSNHASLDAKTIKQRIKSMNTQLVLTNKTLKHSQKHYQCLYFSQHLNWTGKAIVINCQNQLVTLCLDQTAMMIQCYSKQTLPKNSVQNITLVKVDLPNLLLEFKLL